MKAQSQLIKKYVEEHLQEAVSLLEMLGKIPAPSHYEEKRAEFCKDWFIEQGGDEVWIDDAKNTICAIDCDKHEEIVCFMAHTDVVFDDQDQLPMRREDNILFAPGIGDDTANLVNLMMAAKYILQKKPLLNKGILIVANSCEEGLGNLEGCKTIFKNFGDRIKEFYSFDGYMSQCTSTPVGSYRYKISVQEDGGHSYLDFGKDNAIYTMVSLIQDLYEIEVPTEEKTTFNVGNIQGGTTVNSIAEEATILYEYRSSSQKCLSIMEERFNKVISTFEKDGKKITTEILGIRPGKGDFSGKDLESWTQKNIDIITKYYDGSIDQRPFSTDANIPLSRGVLANTIGTIIGGDAHTREEWVDLTSVPQGMSIVLALILQYKMTE